MQSEARPADVGGGGTRGPVKSPIDLGGGLFLMALAAVGFFGTIGLSFGTLTNIGPGLLPRSVSLLIAALGLTLVVSAFLSPGAGLERWHLRGPLFVLGSAVVFALAIRPLGLIIAGPLAVVLSAFADRDTRPVEIGLFAIAMTLLCGLLFKDLLSLPIPFDPIGIVPEWLASGYAAVKKQIADAVRLLFAR